MTYEEKEEIFQAHVRNEGRPQGFHPDGCFYCGGAHASDSCRSEERDEWWRDEREAIR